ncbi:MAG: hypothetical protein GX154_09645 [Clostridiales bacterium]|nr:hypothetical protein [Clostridiales bacterium]
MKVTVKRIIRNVVWGILGEANFFYLFRVANRLCRNYTHKFINYSQANFIELRIPGKDVFFGYYDLDSLNNECDKLLTMVVDQKQSTAEVGYFDLTTNDYIKIADSEAWNWQMGSRLRWFENNKSVMFNTFENRNLISVICGLDGKVIRKFPNAFYDVDIDHGNAYFTDFFILNEQRPGYGYSNGIVRLQDIYDEDANGVYSYDMRTNNKKQLYSIRELRRIRPQDSFNGCYHYVNHISVCRYDGKFMFFHIWSGIKANDWNCRMVVSTKNGEVINVIDDFEIISHYCWKNERQILVTIRKNNSYEYRLYDIYSAKYQVVGKESLVKDGHPSFVNEDLILSDTYPNKLSMQKLFLFGEDRTKVVCEIFSAPNLVGERRCDLHPRFKNGFVNFDSNIYGHRCQYLVNLTPLLKGE